MNQRLASPLTYADYTLIDNAFNTQGTPVATPAAKIAKAFSSGPLIVPPVTTASSTLVPTINDLLKKGKYNAPIADRVDSLNVAWT